MDIEVKDIKYTEPQLKNPRKPNKFICFDLFGNLHNIHEFHQKIDKCIHNWFKFSIELDSKCFIEQNLLAIKDIFKYSEYESKIFPVSSNTVLVLDERLNLEYILTKLTRSIQVIGLNEGVNAETIAILQ